MLSMVVSGDSEGRWWKGEGGRGKGEASRDIGSTDGLTK